MRSCLECLLRRQLGISRQKVELGGQWLETVEMSRVGKLLQRQVSGLDIKGGDEGLDKVSIWG